MQQKYFIRDCSGQIVGNPKGYRTIKGAEIQANSRKSKVHGEIWRRYYAKEKLSEQFDNLIFSIGI